MRMDFSSLGKDQDELSRWMTQDVGIGLNSGTMFGPGGEGFMRINFACPRAQLEEGLLRLKSKLL